LEVVRCTIGQLQTFALVIENFFVSDIVSEGSTDPFRLLLRKSVAFWKQGECDIPDENI
jgi:hypothetical protein